MSFFKDLKEDIAQSVNELTETLDETIGVEEPEVGANETTATPEAEMLPEETTEKADIPIVDLDVGKESVEPDLGALLNESVAEEPVAQEPIVQEPIAEEPAIEEPIEEIAAEEPTMAMEEIDNKEEENVSEELKEEIMEDVMENVVEDVQEPVVDMAAEEEEPKQEVTVITKGTTITGGIKSDTSLVVKGTIEGDVQCEGKLTITGSVLGNTIASEIYVNTPRLQGDINSKGIVKIDVGTVVIGNVTCTSVLVAGAVKGNIEVNGPVIIDSTAVVKGDINAKSLQINSGAVVDGHCSLQFADVDLDSFFE